MTEEKKYYVNFGPELLNLLGPNLYTNIYYVLGELIANAYDADAENVYIIYGTDSDPIRVEDDGNGMTYEQMNENFLPVGIPTRYDSDTALSEKKKRKRMGRKGIGKLGSLTVSDRVRIISRRDGVSSGCILSLAEIRAENGTYEIPGIPESKIKFYMLDQSSNGSAIIMTKCKYKLHKTIASAKRNISLIFPFTSDDFRIHLLNTASGEMVTIEDYSSEIIKMADTLMTFSDTSCDLHSKLDGLHNYFNSDRYYSSLQQELPVEKLPDKKTFNRKNSTLRKTLRLENNSGEEDDYILEITGWIATYTSTRGKKKSSDFSPAHLSIISNGKLGEFNIIPNITQDRVNEAYVVGQLYIDLLEHSDLPDISLSNRQGYKAEDPRYVETLKLAEKNVLIPILNLKTEATDYKNYGKKLLEKERLLEEKNKFDSIMGNMIQEPAFNKVIQESPRIRKELQISFNLKNALNRNYKKVMISHCRENKVIVDELEKILHFCGIEQHEIIYTSSNYPDSRHDPYDDLFKYLKEFFVKTMYNQNLCVIYILNKEFKSNWNATLEAGAGWVLNTHNFIFFTDQYESVKEPLKAGATFIPKCSLEMDDKIDIQNLAIAIKKICDRVKLSDKSTAEIMDFIKTTKLTI